MSGFTMTAFKMNDSLNQQVMMEFESFWIYREMALWAQEQNWDGFAHWLRLQAEEEREHAERLIEVILNRKGTVRLTEIPAPRRNGTTLEEVFAEALEHEKKVTASIEERIAEALQIGDRGTVLALDWFVAEQIEEEKQTEDILLALRRVNGSVVGLLLLDAELKKRPK